MVRAAGVIIGNAPAINLTVPDGGEIWNIGASHDIWWNVSDVEDPNSSLVVDLEYSNSGPGGPWISIVTGLIGDSAPYPWIVPFDPTTTARVRANVTDLDANTVRDTSAADFTIRQPQASPWALFNYTFPSLPVKLESVGRPCQSQARSNVVSAKLRGWMKTFQVGAHGNQHERRQCVADCDQGREKT